MYYYYLLFVLLFLWLFGMFIDIDIIIIY